MNKKILESFLLDNDWKDSLVKRIIENSRTYFKIDPDDFKVGTTSSIGKTGFKKKSPVLAKYATVLPTPDYNVTVLGE